MRSAESGTRFRLFPQSDETYQEPERVWVSPAAGSVGPGPSDPLMHVVDAVDKPRYEPPAFTPPWRRRAAARAMPDARGHFDHIPVDSPAFLSAHLYGSVRYVLDVWEKYLGRQVRWYHAGTYPRLELVPLVLWDNAHSGPGFIETGARRNADGDVHLFCLNFDVIAHEVGHAVLFSEIGVPPMAELTPQFLAFHESLSDVSALLSALHFDTVVDRVLAQTNGNLYVLNMLNRIGEMSGTEQIRIADTLIRMEDVAGLVLAADGSWVDPSGAGRNGHDLGQALTGAIFDIIVDLFQDGLARRGVIDPDHDARGWTREDVERDIEALERAMGDRLWRYQAVFRTALIEARDVTGACIGATIQRLAPEGFTFDRFAAAFLNVAREFGLGRSVPALAENFYWRGIFPDDEAVAAVAAGSRRASPYAERVRAAQLASHRHRRNCCDFALRYQPGFVASIQQLVTHDDRAMPR